MYSMVPQSQRSFNCRLSASPGAESGAALIYSLFSQQHKQNHEKWESVPAWLFAAPFMIVPFILPSQGQTGAKLLVGCPVYRCLPSRQIESCRV